MAGNEVLFDMADLNSRWFVPRLQTRPLSVAESTPVHDTRLLEEYDQITLAASSTRAFGDKPLSIGHARQTASTHSSTPTMIYKPARGGASLNLSAIPERSQWARGRGSDQLLDIYTRSNGVFAFLRNLKSAVLTSGSAWTWIGIYYILCLVPLTMLLIGAFNVGNCPGEPMIPVYLIVAGAIGIIKFALAIIDTWVGALRHTSRRDHVSSIEDSAIYMFYILIDAVITIAIIGWLVVGCIFVYGSKIAFSPVMAYNYCSEVAYSLAFAIVTIQLILIAFLLLLGFMLIFFVTTMNSDKRSSSHS